MDEQCSSPMYYKKSFYNPDSDENISFSQVYFLNLRFANWYEVFLHLLILILFKSSKYFYLQIQKNIATKHFHLRNIFNRAIQFRSVNKENYIIHIDIRLLIQIKLE